MNKQTIRDIDVSNKRVLLRVDFNVPLNKDGTIQDDNRIRAAIPTIEYLLDRGAKVIIMSHLGRPKPGFQPEFSMKQAAERLARLLGKDVPLVDGSVVGPDVVKHIAAMAPCDVCMLENVRFNAGEEANDPAFAASLAALGDVYVNDAFGTAHRAHASTAGIARYLPAVAGFLMEKEITLLGQARDNPEKPFLVVIGGAKASTKLAVLQNLLSKVDKVLIGGGIANTFLKADGREVGKSLFEDSLLPQARQLLASQRERLVLPLDVIVADSLDDPASATVADIAAVPKNSVIVDIGPKTVRLFSQTLAGAKTVVWNGPVGVFETQEFSAGTMAVAAILAGLNATTIVGGGESVAALKKMGFANMVSLLSTGGGASLEFLEGRVLPGVAALRDKQALQRPYEVRVA